MTTESVHLSAEDVAAFVDRRIPTAELPALQAHLATCRTCREEVAAVRRLLVQRPIARPAILVPLGVAAAAVIAFVVLNVGQAGNDLETDRVRTPVIAPAEASGQIAVLSPTDGDTIRAARPVLLWSSVAGEATYRLTMTDAAGRPVWTSTTTDTTITMPANVDLRSNSTYYWYVDALRADGRAASTGVRRFATP